jgi:O-acetyl-ADP-ribose deacetylase (regulator of RNase III)
MVNLSYKGVTIEIKKGDLTEENSDAIVNPANSQMIMGGGVAYIIKKKGGEEIEKEAMKNAPVEIGKSIITGAGRLKSKYVIHSPTMEMPAMKTTKDKIFKATFSSIITASQKGVKSISLPAMGTGVGGVSYDDSAESMFNAIKKAIDSGINIEKISIVLVDDLAFEKFSNKLLYIFQQ